MDHQRELVAEAGGHRGEQIAANLETDGGEGLDPPGTVAVGALAAQGSIEARSGPLPGELDEPDIGYG